MIEIEGLSEEQFDMLNLIWSFESSDEYHAWFECLDYDEQEMARALINLLIVEIIDDTLSADYSEARKVLEKYKL